MNDEEKQLNSESKLLTRAEVAKMLDVSYRTLQRWMDEGRGPSPCYQEGVVARWDLNEIKQWMKNSKKYKSK